MEVAIFLTLCMLLMFLRTPIAFSMLISSFVFMLLKGSLPLQLIPERITISLDSFPLLAFPFFILAGNLMSQVGISKRIFTFALSLFGHMRAGLAQVNVVGSMIFAGMSGSAYADAAGLGKIEIKAMTDEGYEPDFSAAITAASACIGPVIPPSIMMVIYGVMAEVSIGALFAAGFIPGVLMGLAMMITNYVLERQGKIIYNRRPREPLKRIIASFVDALLPLLGPIIILGTIILGVATPTEAGVIAVLYSLGLGLLYKELTWKSFWATLEESAITCGKFLFIMAAANIFGWLITVEQVALNLYTLLTTVVTSKWILLLLIDAALLFLGCFLDGMVIMIISVPALIPIMRMLEVNLVHFGVILTLAIMIGLITPPVGMCIYIVSDIAKVSFDKIVKRVIPFVISLIVTLLVVTYWEGMVMLLPRLIFKA